MTEKTLRIGGASGFWGDASRSTPQLLDAHALDYIVYDYLAEITMSIMARARAKDPAKGYALDFVTDAMSPNLATLSARGIKVISNAGGVNPQACAKALRAEIAKQGLTLKVACVSGDDLLDEASTLAHQGIREMFSDTAFPDADKMLSINAYLGAFPIAEALRRGADIVVTGRCVDSAVTVGACIAHFDWQRDDYDALAMGSLAGHILECGPQATGGNFTDWDQIENHANIGYPIAEIEADGNFICTKPESTGGVVNVGTVSEQMLYEIGDPQVYMLPDVICDFSTATITQVGDNRVAVSGAKGHPAPDTYKVSATYMDQFRGGTYMTFYGMDAQKRARAMGDAVFAAARDTFGKNGLEDFTETSIEILGAESQYGDFAEATRSREVVMKIAAKHPQQLGVGIFLREAVGLSLATPPGLSSFAGTRPSPSPVVRLFSFTIPKQDVAVTIDLDNEIITCDEQWGETFSAEQLVRPSAPSIDMEDDTVTVPLVALAWGRSGDKGNKGNVGIIARDPSYLPYIYATLTEEIVRQRFAHFLQHSDPDCGSVERYLLPGSNAINFLLHDALGGGGVASLRNDPQGKGFAQLLLEVPIPVPTTIAEAL